jgi:hypothetical protein
MASVNVLIAFAVLVQAIETKRMAVQTGRTAELAEKAQAWHVIGGPLYHHIAASLITLRVASQKLHEAVSSGRSGTKVDGMDIHRILTKPFRTNSAPNIINPYIRPEPGMGGAKGNLYPAKIPSLREALDVLEQAARILDAKHIEKRVEEVRKQVSYVISLLKAGDTKLIEEVEKLASDIYALSTEAERTFLIPLTEALVEGFVPTD